MASQIEEVSGSSPDGDTHRAVADTGSLLVAMERIRDLTAPGQELGISDAIELICAVYNEARDAIAKAVSQ